MKKLTCNITVRDATISTNDDVTALAAQDFPEGTVVTARVQSGGRGRLGGRVWESPNGGAYFSLLLRPRCAPITYPSLSPLVALAVHSALRGYGVETHLKQPNDVYVGEVGSYKKICGISLETKTSDTPYVVVGVGINVISGSESNDRFAYLDRLVNPCCDGRGGGNQSKTDEQRIDCVVTSVLESFATMYQEWSKHGTLSRKQEELYQSLLIELP